jgi:O-antigen/teichoic acid export membrane protein
MSKTTTGNQSQSSRLRLILRTGSFVFGLSAFALIAVPGVFNDLLGLETRPDIEWSMRMIGITLVALGGNMFSVSRRGSDESVLFSGRVMVVSAFVLGVITLCIPVQLTWFAIAYALVGFSFSAAYAVVLFVKPSD